MQGYIVGITNEVCKFLLVVDSTDINEEFQLWSMMIKKKIIVRYINSNVVQLDQDTELGSLSVSEKNNNGKKQNKVVHKDAKYLQVSDLLMMADDIRLSRQEVT